MKEAVASGRLGLEEMRFLECFTEIREDKMRYSADQVKTGEPQTGSRGMAFLKDARFAIFKKIRLDRRMWG